MACFTHLHVLLVLKYSDSIQLRTKIQYRLQLQCPLWGITVTPSMLKGGGGGHCESPCTGLLTSVNTGSRNLAELQVEQAVYL